MKVITPTHYVVARKKDRFGIIIRRDTYLDRYRGVEWTPGSKWVVIARCYSYPHAKQEKIQLDYKTAGLLHKRTVEREEKRSKKREKEKKNRYENALICCETCRPKNSSFTSIGGKKCWCACHDIWFGEKRWRVVKRKKKVRDAVRQPWEKIADDALRV